jgi:hypothetical protein
MKVCSGILKQAFNKANDEHFHYYNSLVLTDDIAFQRTYFIKAPTNIPQIYTRDAATAGNGEELPLQTRTHDNNKTLLKIVILIATKAST